MAMDASVFRYVTAANEFYVIIKHLKLTVHYFSKRHIAHDIKNRVQGIDINDTAFKYSEYATKVAGLMNTEKDDDTKTFKVSKMSGMDFTRLRECCCW